jgi:hypothetical protein
MDEHIQCVNHAFALCKKYTLSHILCSNITAARKKAVLCVCQETQVVS